MATKVVRVTAEARAKVLRRVLGEGAKTRLELTPEQRDALARRAADDGKRRT